MTSCSARCSAAAPTSTSPATCATTSSSEFLEQGGPSLLDVSHWAAEWTWLPELAVRLREALGDTVEIRVSTICTDVWQARA